MKKSSTVNRNWHLISRSDGDFAENNFEMRKSIIPAPGTG